MDDLPTTKARTASATHARPGAPSALAFAADSESEHTLREGLTGLPDMQVWPGGLDAALAALGRGAGARLLFVDLDGVPYPAGALHELAAVCEEGTVVVAFGSDGSARFSREVLVSGLSDYLVKPVSAAAVREAAVRAGLGENEIASGGTATIFAGSGGSGVTTLAAAVALIAAERGRYVSLLDLARPLSVLSFVLDVEPAAGLQQLLETAAHTDVEPELIDAVRAQRGERIAVYARRFEPTSAPSSADDGVSRLLVELRRRSHLVLVDGFERLETAAALFAEVDHGVFVVEPTPGGAARAARMLGLLGEGPPPIVVCNHTRELQHASGLRALRRAGLRIRPRVTVPFEPTLPALCDQGWIEGRVPRSLEKPLGDLTGRLLAPAAGTQADNPSLESAPQSKSERGGAKSESRSRRPRRASWWPRPRAAARTGTA